MSIEVDFITLGDASDILSKQTIDNDGKYISLPSGTLRHWTDQLEEMDVHYVMRNNRNERIYNSADLEIFGYMRDIKKEYGRRTTTRDIGFMIIEKGEKGELKLRDKDNAPKPNRSNRTAELLGQEDLKQLMDSDRVKQFMEIVSTNIGSQIYSEMNQKMDDMKEELMKSNMELREELARQEEKWENRIQKRDELLVDSMRSIVQEKQKKKSFIDRLMGR